LVLTLIGSGCRAVLVAAGAPAGWFPVPIFVAVASLGLVLSNATSLALAQVPRAAGTASAALGASQFALGAAVGWKTGSQLMHESNI